MPQKTDQTYVKYLNLDSKFEDLGPTDSPFLKNISTEINGNPDTTANNPTGEGQNSNALTPYRSNRLAGNVVARPAGNNYDYGSFYSATTHETYSFNRNSNGNHGIYVYDGDTGIESVVVVSPNLPFTSDQSGYLAPHRVSLRILFDSDGNIAAKFLVYTNGEGWQGWINVIAAIATGGFNTPYFKLLPPHFDARELIEWAPRPCMYNPVVTAIANTSSDLLKPNRIIDRAFEFAAGYNYTDGRPTTFSPYSLPAIVKTEDFLNSPDVLPKNFLVTIYAGSSLVESIDLYIRYTAAPQAGLPSTTSYGDWFKYIRLYKFTNCGTGTDVVGTTYWTRINPWANNNYDLVQNTIQYTFDNSILPDLVDQNDANRLQTDMPLRSIALTDFNDAAGLADNLYGYGNLPCTTMDNLSVEVVENPASSCPTKTVTIKLYAYIGMCSENFDYFSQVGYFVGADTTVRFGSLRTDGVAVNATYDEKESKFFGLDFADKKAFRCYLKGTPFYTDGVWTQVNSDNSLVPLPDPLDFSDIDNLEYVQNVFKAQGFFVCMFTFDVPPGRYIATLGRHSVASTGDFINTSTYIEGIASSRIKSILVFQNIPTVAEVTVIAPTGGFGRNNAIVSQAKEMEIDCTNGSVDVWGKGADLFYVYCPYIPTGGNGAFRFIEGYFQESVSEPIGVEYFPYQLTVTTDDSGAFTDKNGFYFAYTKKNDSAQANIQMIAKVNCAYPTVFELITSKAGIGWCVNAPSYLSDHNNGQVGGCNRVIVPVSITSVDGKTPYSNIAVSIVGGETVYTASDGTATLIVHNGKPSLRTDNIYVNAGGGFLITIADCGAIPLFVFDEADAPCFNCAVRTYPFPIILGVNIIGGTQHSLKSNASYSAGVALADLAGRMTFVNVVGALTVQSFNARADLNATFARLLISGPLSLPADLKWIAPYVSPQLNIQKYIEWVGDSIAYIDNAGNVVDGPNTAVLCSISIQSLYNTNVSNNFSLLSTYQFSPGDRIIIYDDGNGNLLPTPIDLQILGTNYNQAAMAAYLIPNTSTQPIVNNNQTINVANTINTATTSPTSTTSFATAQNNQNITLYVRFDSRLTQLQNDTGFWIELDTPMQQTETIKYWELVWYPVINGEIAIFTGYDAQGRPTYTYPTSIDIPFWDTYLFTRNIAIPGVGNKFLGHPFESPNISDNFGANVTSGGRQLEKNDDAVQQWIEADIIKSDAFVGNGILNGLATFRASNRKTFSQYPVGAIIAMHTERSIVICICKNDWFTITFDFHFTYPNQQGVMVVNLDDSLSQPTQKMGSNFGLAAADTGSVVIYDRRVWWYDRVNEAYVECNYQSAKDISDIRVKTDEGIMMIGVKSYFTKKTQSIQDAGDFRVVAGIDTIRQSLFVTFRDDQNGTNDLRSYVNQRRNISLGQRETIVYNLLDERWRGFAGFTPEGYSMLKGASSGLEMITYAAGLPYIHNNTGNTSFANFYTQQTEPVFVNCLNAPKDVVKILESISMDSTVRFFIDLICSDETNSYSYIPANYFKNRENIYYTHALRNLNSYPVPGVSPNVSMLIDGKRNFGVYFLCRFVQEYKTLGAYFEINNIYSLEAQSSPNKK